MVKLLTKSEDWLNIGSLEEGVEELTHFFNVLMAIAMPFIGGATAALAHVG